MSRSSHDTAHKKVQKAVYRFTKEDPVAAALCQEINIQFANKFPTACVGYDKQTMKFFMGFGPAYIHQLSDDEVFGVLKHEIFHFTHKHLFRFFEKDDKDDHQLMNIAADMAINQYIQVLPKGCVNYEDWKAADGGPMQPWKSFDYYYNNLKQTTGKNKNPDKEKDKGNVEQLKKYVPMDEHQTEGEELTEEEKKEMYGKAAEAVKRALEKVNYGYDETPGHFRDLLQYLEAQTRGYNWQQLLRKAIKASLSVDDKKYTWSRPHRRYGKYFKGSKNNDMPTVHVYMDTSGSISWEEHSHNLNLVIQMTKHYKNKFNLHLFHTEVYHTSKQKKIKKDEIEIASGGTCLREVIGNINKKKPEIYFIFTDGYYGHAGAITNPNPGFFIISEGGDLNHPYKMGYNTINVADINRK